MLAIMAIGIQAQAMMKSCLALDVLVGNDPDKINQLLVNGIALPQNLRQGKNFLPR